MTAFGQGDLFVAEQAVHEAIRFYEQHLGPDWPRARLMRVCLAGLEAEDGRRKHAAARLEALRGYEQYPYEHLATRMVEGLLAGDSDIGRQVVDEASEPHPDSGLPRYMLVIPTRALGRVLLRVTHHWRGE